MRTAHPKKRERVTHPPPPTQRFFSWSNWARILVHHTFTPACHIVGAYKYLQVITDVFSIKIC